MTQQFTDGCGECTRMTSELDFRGTIGYRYRSFRLLRKGDRWLRSDDYFEFDGELIRCEREFFEGAGPNDH